MRLTTTILLGALVSIPALTATAAANELEEVMVTAFRTPVAGAEIIGNQAAIDGESLEIRGPTHIQQALLRVPGVNLQHNSGQEYLPAIRSPVLTGPGACGSFLMAEDGIPLRPAGFCNVNELFESHYEQADRIEVIRGPSAAFYGSNALHGVVNVIMPDIGAIRDQLSLEYGSEDFYRLGLSSNLGDFAVSFTGTRDGGFRDTSGVDSQKLTVRGSHLFGDMVVDSGVTLINLNQETAGYIEGYKAYEDDDLVETNPNPEAYRDARALRLWARFADREEQPGWVVTPYARYSDMAFLMHFLPGTPVEENGQESLGFQSAFFGYGERSRWAAGLDAEVVDGWLEQYQSGPTQGSPFLEETIPQGYHYDYSVLALQLSPFVHWDYAINEQWDFSAGLRYEWMEYDYDNHMLAGRTREDGTACGFGGCRYSRPADGTDDFSNWSPRVGISYTPAADHRFYLSFSRGFRAPQAVELYRLQRDQSLADLDSEELDSVELGYQGRAGRWNYEVIAYAMKKRNLIFRDSDFFNVSSGQTRHKGLEAYVAFQATEQLSFTLSGSQASHEYDYDEVLSGININGNDVDGSPHHFGVFVTRWAQETWAVELEWLHMGSYYTDPENLHKYEGHDVFNLLASVDLSESLRVHGRITNLLDEEFAERADYTTFSGDRYFPGAPRSLFVGVDWLW